MAAEHESTRKWDWIAGGTRDIPQQFDSIGQRQLLVEVLNDLTGLLETWGNQVNVTKPEDQLRPIWARMGRYLASVEGATEFDKLFREPTTFASRF
jgi:hypothetical protein